MLHVRLEDFGMRTSCFPGDDDWHLEMHRFWWLLLLLPALMLYLFWTYLLAPYIFTPTDEVGTAATLLLLELGALSMLAFTMMNASECAQFVIVLTLSLLLAFSVPLRSMQEMEANERYRQQKAAKVPPCHLALRLPSSCWHFCCSHRCQAGTQHKLIEISPDVQEKRATRRRR